MSTKILLYEDNEELRSSLSCLINFTEGLELLAAYENCEGIEQHLKTHHPDLVLMDIDMPVVNGIEGLKIIRKIQPELPVIMLTIFEDNEHIFTAIREGATGYILKQNLTTQLSSAIQEALNGGAPMSPVVAKLVLQFISGRRQDARNYGLTQREKDILQSLTDGNSCKMIAANLGITFSTVATHIKNIYEKLGVHSQAEAISKTLREQIL